MDKMRDDTFPLHELLSTCWSPRAFSEQPVEPEKLGVLLEAARWAPSSYNEQPWRFLLATREQPAEYERMLNWLFPGNRSWAFRAPVLILTVAKLTLTVSGKPNRHAFHDVGLAIGNLTVQATALGLRVRQMQGFDGKKARYEANIPAEYEPLTMLAIGYEGQADVLSEDSRIKEGAPRLRRSLPELAFTGQWGNTATVIFNSVGIPKDEEVILST